MYAQVMRSAQHFHHNTDLSSIQDCSVHQHVQQFGPISSLRIASYTDHPKFERLHRTGDLTFHTFNGELYLVGPQDNQIELQGMETKLGEIERSIQKDTDRRVAALVCRASRSSHSGPVIALFEHFTLTSDKTTALGQRDPRNPWLLLPRRSVLETLVSFGNI